MIKNLEQQKNKLGREFDRCKMCDREIFVGQKFCEKCKLFDMPRVWRDEKNRGTWIDGEWISDRILASIPPNELTKFWPYKKEMRGTDIANVKFYPNKHEENAMRNLDCRGRMGYKESFYDRWPTKKSRIGWLFYLGGRLWSRLLRKHLIHLMYSSKKLYLLLVYLASQL